MGHDRYKTSFLATVKADVQSVGELKGRRKFFLITLFDLFTLPGVWAVVLFRLASFFHSTGLRPLSRLTFFLNYVLFGIEIFPGAQIGPGLVVPHPIGIGIAAEVVIGKNFHAMAGVRLGGVAAERPEDDGFPVIGDDCWMLDGAKAFGNVHIGDGSLIGASSVVMSDVPDHVIAAGIPARVIRPRP